MLKKKEFKKIQKIVQFSPTPLSSWSNQKSQNPDRYSSIISCKLNLLSDGKKS